MSADKRGPRSGPLHSNRERVQQHSIQPRQTSIGSSNEQVREDAEGTDWERSFKFLSAALGRQWISSDKLILIAYAIRDHVGDEAMLTYMEHVGLNRDKKIHDFMG